MKRPARSHSTRSHRMSTKNKPVRKPDPKPESPPVTRARRPRGTPGFLTESRPDVNEIARRRTLMILSVLSGETPVTTAIEREGISRQTYYLWETRALNAILAAMVPSELAPGFDPAVTAE